MKAKSESLDKLQRICVLSFDEIYISNMTCIEKINQQALIMPSGNGNGTEIVCSMEATHLL